MVVNESGGSSGGREETKSLTFQGGATVDLPCRWGFDDMHNMLCPGYQRLVALHCRLPEGPDLVWKKLGGELPPQHQLTRNALRLQRVNINTTSKKNETKKGQTF